MAEKNSEKCSVLLWKSGKKPRLCTATNRLVERPVSGHPVCRRPETGRCTNYKYVPGDCFQDKRV